MKSILLSIGSSVLCCLSLMGESSLLRGEGFTPFVEELKVDNGSLPQKIEIDLPSPGHVRLEAVKLPEGATFFSVFPKVEGHVSHGHSGQARLVAGKHTILIQDRWGKKTSGPIHIKAVVTPENDPTEPNDTVAQAKAVGLGETAITVFPVGDVDYLKVNVPDRGYLNVYAVDAPEGFTSHCEVYDFNNVKVGVNFVRIALPGEYKIKCMDRWTRFGHIAPIKLKIDFHPEEDPAEPNDLIEDAAEIPIGVWQQAIAAPAADVDFHELNIESDARIAFSLEDLDKNLQIQSAIYDAEGKKLELAYPYTVRPGKYFIKTWERFNRLSLKPYRLKFDLLPIQKITPTEEEKATVIDSGLRYDTLIQSGSEQDRFALKIGKPSIVQARLMVPEGSDYRLSYQLQGGKPVTWKSVWFRVSEPEVEFTIKPYYNQISYRPIGVQAEVEEEFDPSEPNDFSHAPASLELNQPRMFFLYPYKDQDWFKISINEPGRYFVHVVQPTEDSSMRFGSLVCRLHDTAGKQINWVSLDATAYGFSSRPVEIKNAGEYLFYVSSEGSSRASLVIGVNAKSSLDNVDAEEAELDVFVAGVELKPDVAKRMENMVKSGGGEFLNAAKAEEISGKLVEIADQIEERSAAVLGTKETEKASSSIWWIWLLLLFIASTGVFWWLKKKKQGEEEKLKEA